MQAFTGLSWLNRDDAIHRPIPFGLAIADMMTGAHLVQGILAALVRRSVQGTGALVEVNMLESTLDVMQEIWDEKWMPDRCSNEGAGEAESSRWLKGLYPTATGYIALEEMSLYELKKALEAHFSSATINEVTADSIQQLLLTKPADYWCIQLRKAGIACEELLNWEQLLGQEAFRDLNITQNIYRSNGARLTALSCPIRLNGYRLQSSRGAPYIGEHNGAIELEWLSHS